MKCCFLWVRSLHSRRCFNERERELAVWAGAWLHHAVTTLLHESKTNRERGVLAIIGDVSGPCLLARSARTNTHTVSRSTGRAVLACASAPHLMCRPDTGIFSLSTQLFAVSLALQLLLFSGKEVSCVLWTNLQLVAVHRG